jgi:glutamyl-tRNA reductase
MTLRVSCLQSKDYDRKTVIYKHICRSLMPLSYRSSKSGQILYVASLHLIFIIALITIFFNYEISNIKPIQMKLVLNNLTYHNCPVHLREKVAFTEKQRRFMLEKMRAEKAVSEAAVLETCNRLEFYLYAEKGFDCDTFLADLIARLLPDAAEIWAEHSGAKTGRDVVQHLFEVAAGLDSQMLGENQILSQVKSAYTMSIDCRMSKIIFHRLFHSAFRAGKAVRTHTHINRGAVSVGLAAVELAKSKIDLSAATAMLIGAGENAELVARYLLKAQLRHLIIANRSINKARVVASHLKTGRAIALPDIPAALSEVDLLISSTAAAQPVVKREMVQGILAAREKPLLIIDIAVPRDIDPRIGQFECVTLVNIDDLDEQININREKRSSEIPKARAIVADFTDKFIAWYDSLDIVPAISRLTKKGMELAHAEARRYARDFGDENADKLKSFAESLVRKVLHGPIAYIKDGGNSEPTTDQLQAADLINKMFFSEDESD